MLVRKNYNFRAVLAAYIGAGLVVAFLIHFIVLSSPKYNWIFPQTTTAAAMAPAPAPGAK
ncbi:MAG: hypothetical protein NVS2B8_08370 [Vulcanimicrobiaceae bacterium]